MKGRVALPDDSLSLRGSFNIWVIPWPWDDGGAMVAVSHMAKVSGIHRTTLIAATSKGAMAGQKIDGRWFVRMERVTRFFDGEYRYSRSGYPLTPRTGKTWNRWERLVLSLPVSHKAAAKRLGRSYSSVKTMRCKIRRK